MQLLSNIRGLAQRLPNPFVGVRIFLPAQRFLAATKIELQTQTKKKPELGM
jgi:hypothetical protein